MVKVREKSGKKKHITSTHLQTQLQLDNFWQKIGFFNSAKTHIFNLQTNLLKRELVAILMRLERKMGIQQHLNTWLATAVGSVVTCISLRTLTPRGKISSSYIPSAQHCCKDLYIDVCICHLLSKITICKMVAILPWPHCVKPGLLGLPINQADKEITYPIRASHHWPHQHLLTAYLLLTPRFGTNAISLGAYYGLNTTIVFQLSGIDFQHNKYKIFSIKMLWSLLPWLASLKTLVIQPV